ncbi:hypothetical protein OG792_34410 [Micromonospora sp. NBC_01699]|uniref:hypothetical protein n=1 Tax=Micromonospora sp. NBC_01699 TaxID=2975984 RepID=UPI002E2E0C8D|nr:hypothetical protein [Micromonospora sp. NBC_01699]
MTFVRTLTVALGVPLVGLLLAFGLSLDCAVAQVTTPHPGASVSGPAHPHRAHDGALRGRTVLAVSSAPVTGIPYPSTATPPAAPAPAYPGARSCLRDAPGSGIPAVPSSQVIRC